MNKRLAISGALILLIVGGLLFFFLSQSSITEKLQGSDWTCTCSINGETTVVCIFFDKDDTYTFMSSGLSSGSRYTEYGHYKAKNGYVILSSNSSSSFTKKLRYSEDKNTDAISLYYMNNEMRPFKSCWCYTNTRKEKKWKKKN